MAPADSTARPDGRQTSGPNLWSPANNRLLHCRYPRTQRNQRGGRHPRNRLVSGWCIKERMVPDTGDAVGDRDAGQAGATTERIVPDAGDGVWDRVASGFASRTLDKRDLALVEQHPLQAAVGRV